MPFDPIKESEMKYEDYKNFYSEEIEGKMHRW